MKGKDTTQKMKKHIKSLVLVPEDKGMEFGISLTLGQIARSITKTHEPPILDCTPYQIHAIVALLNTHHKLPNIPKLARLTTGKVTWNTAPGRPARTTNGVITP